MNQPATAYVAMCAVCRSRVGPGSTSMITTWVARAPTIQPVCRNGTAASRESRPPRRSGVRTATRAATEMIIPTCLSDRCLSTAARERAQTVSSVRMGHVRPGRRPAVQHGGGHWSSDVVALHPVAAQGRESVVRGLVLDPFGDSGEPERMGKFDGGAHDDGAVRIGSHVPDERLVDLDL